MFLTVPDVKSQLRIPDTDTSSDAEVGEYIDAATAVVQRHTGELMTQISVTEIRDTGCALSRELVVDKAPLVSVTSVASLDGGRSWSVDDLVLDGASILFTGQPVRGRVRVSYTAGYEGFPPANYALAGRIIIQHLWETRRGNMPLASAELGDSMQPYGFGFAIPNRALELLGAPMPGVA